MGNNDAPPKFPPNSSLEAQFDWNKIVLAAYSSTSLQNQVHKCEIKVNIIEYVKV